MTRLEMFKRKHGDAAGAKLYHALQANAANARWKTFYKKR